LRSLILTGVFLLNSTLSYAEPGEYKIPVVWLKDSCTGVLVTERILLYAGHCGTEFKEALLGSKVLRIKSCTEHPNPEGGPGTGTDAAFCELETPVAIWASIVYTEPVVGEIVTFIGFGSGARKATGGRVSRVGLELSVDLDNGETLHNGDSGGPLLVKTGRTWKVVGIASSQPSKAATASRFTLLKRVQTWVTEVVLKGKKP
jgi:hypothetical protein